MRQLLVQQLLRSEVQAPVGKRVAPFRRKLPQVLAAAGSHLANLVVFVLLVVVLVRGLPHVVLQQLKKHGTPVAVDPRMVNTVLAKLKNYFKQR